MALEILQELGLTKSEISTYLALLELGQSTTGPIVDKAKISSSKIYEILDKLIQKGLVSYILKGKVKYFEATNPERILDLLKEKEKELEKQRNEIKKLLPELTRKKDLSKYKENAGIYKGMKGLEITFYESLNNMKNETIYIIGIPSRSEKVNRFFVKWNKYRAELGIKEKALFNEKARGELQTLPENTTLTEIKYMPEGIVTPAAINILGNRTLIFPAETKDEPLLIMIESKEIADSFKAQFELLWNMQSKEINGIEGPSYVLKDVIRTLKKNEEDLVFGLEENKINNYPAGVLDQYYKEIKLKGIKERMILKTGTNLKDEKNSLRKYLPKEYFNPIHYEIYGNKVAMINWNKPITTIITENKNMADSFRIYFNNLWKIAKN